MLPIAHPLDPIARLRRFNRIVTRATGALDTSFMGRGRPLGVVRVLQQVTAAGTDVARIRDHLSLDSGLTSRILRSLAAEHLITVHTAPADRRRRIATLTAKGQTEMATYDAIGYANAANILSRAPDQGRALLSAMDLIATTLNRDHVEIRPADPDDPAALACLAAYFQLLCDTIPNLTPADLPLPDPKADHYRPPHGAFLLAWSEDLPIGTVSLRRLSPQLAEVKRLWIAPDARGQGLARRLMRAIEDTARTLGYTRLNLDTNAALPGVLTLYETSGWTQIPAYTGFPSTHWFSKPL